MVPVARPQRMVVDKSVATVPQAQSEEQHEEGGKEIGGVYVVVVGQRIHLQDRLEETAVPVEGYLNGHIVLVGRIFRLVEDVCSVKIFHQGCRGVCLHPSHNQPQVSLGHTFIAEMDVRKGNVVSGIQQCFLQQSKALVV